MRSLQQSKAVAAGKPEGQEIAGITPGQWTWLGPGNIGGRIRTIVIDPSNPNRMWIGSVSGGIWHSTNAGGTWSPVNDFMANLAVSTMVIDPTNSNILYAGTGESFSAGLDATEGESNTSKQRGDGVFKSVDGGITWNQLARTNTADPTVCAAAGPICPWSYVNRLTISRDGTAIIAATLTGIFRSIDGGANWTLTTAGLRSYLDADFDPTNSQNAVASGTGGLVSVYSANGGQSWQNATYTPAISLGGSTGRIEIAYAPSNPSIVYAMIDATQGAGQPPPNGTLVKGNLYKSLDRGATFNLVNASNPGNTFLGGQGDYDNIIWVNPQDSNFILVGGINMYRSTDGGLNWGPIADGRDSNAHSDHHMIVSDPGFNNNTNKKVFFSNDGGIYRVDDVSAVSVEGAWTKLNNSLGVTQFYSASANALGVIVGGTQDNGTLRYTGNAQNWTSMFGGDGGYTAADPTDPGYFYSEYTNLGIVRSTDSGSTSGYIYCNPAPTSANGGPCVPPATGILDAFNGANFIAPFILDPNDPNTMLAGGLSLWRSNDIKAAGLPTWSAVKPPSSDRRPAPRLGNPNPISAISVSENNSDFILIGHNDGQIFLTFDGTSAGPTWVRIDAGIPATRFVTRLVIDETRSPSWIYATLGGFAGDNIYRSKDLGATWSDITGLAANGLPNVPVRDLAISPAVPNNIYAATEIGIFASENAGLTWGLPQDGPANVAVDQLIWAGGQLVAVTHGRGIYKTSNAVYNFPVCTAPLNCTCFGDWDCPCSWNSHKVPTFNDDIAIFCPVWLKPLQSNGGKARNLSVNNRLTLDNNLGVTGLLSNAGYITSNTGIVSSISAGSLTNSRPQNVLTLAGIIQIRGGITITGNAINSGVVSVGNAFESVDLNTAPNSTLTGTTVNIKGDLINSGLIQPTGTISVRGNILNFGTLKGALLVPTAPSSLVKTYSGSGSWEVGAFTVPAGFNVKLGSNLTFDIPTISNSGVLDFSDKTLNVKGSSFQGVGTVTGTGTLRFVPTTGFSVFNANGPAVTIGSGTVEYRSGGTVSGPLTIETGATLAMNTSGTLSANGDVTVNGSLTKTGGNPQFAFNGQTFTNNGTIGNIDFMTFNDGTGPPVQFVQGIGDWLPTNIQIGAGTPMTLNLGTNVNFTTNQLITANGAALNVGNFVLGMKGPTNVFRGVIKGTGLVKIQPSSGTPNLGIPLTIDTALEIASGTVKSGGATVKGKLTVNSGATLSLLNFTGITANGDVLNNGTINAFSGSPSIAFNGNTFTNNGSITGGVNVNFGAFFAPILPQSLAGTGSWTGSQRLLVDSFSATTMLSDVNYSGGNMWVEGRVSTGPFRLSLPCTVVWSGAGEVTGNIRRTNLAACPGTPIAFGNPFTTIQFTSGTAPSEIDVQILPGAPAGLPTGVQRTYLITPIGGNGYSATLRLHYLDSELNGNDEATLQLWRNDGSSWAPQGVTNRNTTQNWVEFTGVSQFSPWTLASANSTARHLLTMNAGTGGTVGPTSEYFDAGQSVQITATPNAGYRFIGWSGTGNGAYTGTNNPASVTMNAPVIQTAAFAPLTKSPFDFDGDGKTDISIFRPSLGQWWLNRSNLGTVVHTFGNSADKLTPGDFNGDGVADVAIYRPSTGEWFVLRSENFSFYSFPFGASSDIPVPADYDGDNKTDAAVFRPSNLTWYIQKSSGGTTIETFGAAGDVPVPADYDGDGKADIAIYRPSLGQWWLNRSTAGIVAVTFGVSTDKTVQGDYTGDGKADIAIWRPATGEWLILRSEDFTFYSFPFGANGDAPAPGDYDGDGKFDAAVFRSSAATWYIQRSTAGTLIQNFGAATDIAVPNAFVR